jgi:2-amino-4-hydroxy-6-hydroxymethyldihydropteridine diphosphokinase
VSEGPPASAKTAYIGIGSNMGDPLNNCHKAIDLINHLDGCRVAEISRFFHTEPVGATSQDWYVNGVIRIETTLGLHELMRSLLSIESGMGRVRRQKWESRIIDLDILLYGNEAIEESDLRVPHPLMHQRRFVIMPMAELNPGLIHPVLGKSMAELMDNLMSVEGQAVIPVSDI